MMDGYTPHGPMTEQPTQVRFTSMVLKITLVSKRAPNGSGTLIIGGRNGGATVAGLVDEVAVWNIAADGEYTLSLPLVRVHSTTTVTDYLIHGQLDSVSLTQTQTQTVTELPTQTSSCRNQSNRS